MDDKALTQEQILKELRYDLGALWAETRSLEAVHGFIREHPDQSQELYELVAFLIECELTEEESQESNRAWNQRVQAYLQTEGFALVEKTQRAATSTTTPTTGSSPPVAAGGPLPAAGARQAATPGRTLLRLLQDETKLHPDEVARALDVPIGFLLELSHHGTLVPPAARAEIGRRAAARFAIDASAVTGAFTAEPSLRRAASRGGAFGPPPQDFTALVERAGLSSDVRAYWLALAGE